MLPLVLATLTLVLTDVQRLPLDRRVLRTATAAALAGSGVELEWDSEAPGQSRPLRDEEARVILTSSHPSGQGNRRVLGAVLREGGPVRAIWIYVDDVRLVVQGTTPFRRLSLTHDVSVAVGRVLAHEVAHLLAPRHPHASEGLMAGEVNRKVLAGTLPLDSECLAAIRVSLSAPAASSPPLGPRSPITAPARRKPGTRAP